MLAGMHHLSPLYLTDAQRAELAERVREHGLARIARRIGMDRYSLASVIAGTERRGTNVLCAQLLAIASQRRAKAG
jgi:hypothetical protein